jgi:predicted transcriptional regulator
MKNNIFRIPTEPNKFSTINNNVLFNTEISSDAFRLLIILLNNSKTFQINLNYYSNEFGWSKDKPSKIVKELISNGYLERKQLSKGQGKGFTYYYIISEYGNLKKDSNVKTEEPVQSANDIVSAQVQNVISTPEPVKQIEEQPKQSELIEDNFPTDKQFKMIDDSLNGKSFIEKIGTEIALSIEKGNINSKSFNIEEINKYINKREKELTLDFAKTYDLENPKGTIAQQKATTSIIMNWLNQELNAGYIPSQKEITSKHLKIRHQITTANRVITEKQD